MFRFRAGSLPHTIFLWSAALTLLLTCSLALAAERSRGKQLVTDFWRADTVEQRQQAARQLQAAAPDVATLYQWLKAGPDYARDVPTGTLEYARYNADGLRFPYVLLVPDDYDPDQSYPVEFMLHGGVSRPPWQDGQQWWRRGYDSLRYPDRITVVPASWNEAFWWFANQAENLPAILKSVKQQYNVNENRVYLTGVSDGGTGTYFFAFRQPTHWAAYMPYIGHMAVLRNRDAGGGHPLFFDNLTAKPLYIVNGEDDPLYPVYAVRPYIDYLEQAKVPHVFKAIFEGGHNTNWLPEETPLIEKFKEENPRDPLPDSVLWITESAANYQRNHWLRIDEMLEEGQPGKVEVLRDGNILTVKATYVTAFTLLLNPEEIDFNQAVQVEVNGTLVLDKKLEQSAQTLLKWAAEDLDRSMLFTAELALRTPQ